MSFIAMTTMLARCGGRCALESRPDEPLRIAQMRRSCYLPPAQHQWFEMSFSHPLASKAKVWPTKARDGSERRVLVVITTLALDPESERYRKKLVDRLSDAVSVYLADNAEINEYVMMNRMRDWD
jgi:hypothetical protein